MIFYLRHPGTHRISISRYRTRDICESQAGDVIIERVERGNALRLQEVRDRFASCAGVSASYVDEGGLASFLRWPAHITIRDVASRYALTKGEVLAAMKALGLQRTEITPCLAGLIYEKAREFQRAEDYVMPRTRKGRTGKRITVIV